MRSRVCECLSRFAKLLAAELSGRCHPISANALVEAAEQT